MSTESNGLTASESTESGDNPDTLMARIRAEAAVRGAQHRQVWQPVDHLELLDAPQRIPEPADFQAAPRPEPGKDFLVRSDTVHCRDLLRFTGEAFVEQAYLAILGRAPDPKSSRLAANYLRRGGSEFALLAELLLSEEGCDRGAELQGLTWALRRHRLCRRLSVVGSLLKLLTLPIDWIMVRRRRPALMMDDFNYCYGQRVGELHALGERWTSEKNELLSYTRDNDFAIRLYLDKFADTTTRNLELLSKRSSQQLEILQRLTMELERLRQQLQELGRNHRDAVGSLTEATESINQAIAQISADVGTIGAQSEASVDEVNAIAARAREIETQALNLRQDWYANRRGFEAFMQDMRAALTPQDLPADEDAEDTAAEASDIDAANADRAARVLAEHQDGQLDAYYAAFEESCRGQREDIKQGLQHYLPHFDTLKSVPKLREAAVLDLGCGRGEWLELLGENGWQAEGVDMSRIMVDVCAEYGLVAQHADAIACLKRLDNSSLAAVTGFHIIEHLPFEVLFMLMNEAMRTVRSGGLVLFETPNPENILVGSHTFYHDFTHRNPVTPTAISFLAQYVGFANIRIIRSHPYPESARVEGNDPLTERVNGHLCGPQDFAILARKPVIDASGRLAE